MSYHSSTTIYSGRTKLTTRGVDYIYMIRPTDAQPSSSLFISLGRLQVPLRYGEAFRGAGDTTRALDSCQPSRSAW